MTLHKYSWVCGPLWHW